MQKILVLCTGNSCRSQLAEGYLRHFAHGKAEVYSAGVETHGVNPKAIQPALEKLFAGEWKKGDIPELWDGKTSGRIVKHLVELLS